MSDFISYRELKKDFVANSAEELAAVLANQNIPFGEDSKGRPVTTIQAINKALGLDLNVSVDYHSNISSATPKLIKVK